MTTTEVRPGTGSIQQWTLPPGWEAIRSEKDDKVYYWNKKTGATTWKFPDKEGKMNSVLLYARIYAHWKFPDIEGKTKPIVTYSLVMALCYCDV